MKKLLILLLFPVYCFAQQPLYYNLATGKYLVGGLSSDTKPVNPPDNCYFLEANTGNCFISSGGSWNAVTIGITQSAFNGKQATLVSGTTIKTINGSTVLGSGDLVVSGSAAWGSVTGTLSNQTDVSNAINAKQATITTGTTAQYFRGDLSLATFPTTTAAFVNSTDKNFVSDAKLTVVNNTTGTNTGDNATNTQYSGLAASKANIAAPAFTGSFGYATGSGSSVTQATSKTTGVTLNNICGRITMNGAALAAAAEVSFTVTNSTVAATDVVIVNIQSVGTAGSYFVTVGAVSAGSFAITLGNASAGSLSQAVVLNFVVIKSVIN